MAADDILNEQQKQNINLLIDMPTTTVVPNWFYGGMPVPLLPYSETCQLIIHIAL
jgi:hypothetical protein